MRRDPRTVRAEDAVSLVEALMRWEGIRHVPVEDEEDRLVGIVSVRDLLVAVKEGRVGADAHVGEIMATDVVTVDPETPTLDVIRQMRERRIACMPVVREGRLVGMVSESDFLRVVERLLG
jgi:CBS domain-containing protein